MKQKLITLLLFTTLLNACNSGKSKKKIDIGLPLPTPTPTPEIKVPPYQTGQTPPDYNGRVVFDNVNVLTMTSPTQEEFLFDYRVVIENEKIVAMGTKESVEILASDNVIDGNNGYLLPGFIDSHMHFTHAGPGDPNPLTFTDPAQMSLYLQQGITTVRAYSGTPKNIEWRNKVDSDEWLGTKIITSGPKIHDKLEIEEIIGFPWDSLTALFTSLTPVVVPDNRQEGHLEVIKQKEMTYDFLKVYAGLNQETFLAVAEQAKSDNLFLTGHIPNVSIATALAHFQEVAHIVEVTPMEVEYAGTKEEYQQWLVNTMLENDISLVFNWSTDEVNKELNQGIDVFSRDIYQVLPKELLDVWRQLSEADDIDDEITAEALALAKILVDAGVVLQVGSDTGDVGSIPVFIHRDFELMIEAGITPYQALRAGTYNPAQVISRITSQPQDRGIIAAGYLADLVLLKDNPLTNISNTRDQHGVMIDGHWFANSELKTMVEHFVSLPIIPHNLEFK
jgi:hypothetical protein